MMSIQRVGSITESQSTYQVKRNDKFLSWNNFPGRVRQSFLNRLKNNINNPKQSNKFMEDNDATENNLG